MKIRYYAIFILFTIILFVIACKKNKLPKVSTVSFSSVSKKSVTLNGALTSHGKHQVYSLGFCWSTDPDPTEVDAHINVEPKTGSYESIIPGLQPNTTYYVRAFAKNVDGTAYGSEMSFKTLLYEMCDTISYTTQIKNMIDLNCNACHSGPFPSGGVDLTTYANVKASVDAGRLQDRVNNTNNPMPPIGLMPQTERDKIECWIQNGALQ